VCIRNYNIAGTGLLNDNAISYPFLYKECKQQYTYYIAAVEKLDPEIILFIKNTICLYK